MPCISECTKFYYTILTDAGMYGDIVLGIEVGTEETLSKPDEKLNDCGPSVRGTNGARGGSVHGKTGTVGITL